MADQRGMRFPQGGQGGYMNPGGQQFPMMPQQYPMMMPGMVPAGGNPAMQQQMMMQGFQQGMFPGQMPQGGYAQPGMMPGPGMQQQPGGQQFNRPPPPGYNAQMAQEYQAKHNKMMQQQKKMMETQQKKMAEAMKQKQFQDQQRKLKEFSAMGGRKMDADSLIHSILGPSDKKRPSPPTNVVPQQPMGQFGPGMLPTSTPQQMPNNVNVNNMPQQAVPVQDDFADFGDFMEGPSAAQPQPQPQQHLNNQQMPTTQQNNAEIPQQVVETPAEKVKENKKDLTSMMFESCDLTAPQKAKGFVKPTVKDLQPQKVKTSSFQASQKARNWDGNTETLTELFTLPAQPVNPEPTPTPPPASKGPIDFSILPKWCSGKDELPEIYHQVLEASVLEEKICIDRLYPILMRSGLQREVLGHIWSLANRHTPGELLKEELNIVLAMIAIAQNNLSIASIDILKKCPKPPVPFLGQTLPQQKQPEPQGQQPVPPPTTHPPNSNNSAQHGHQPVQAVTPTVSEPNAAEEDDFADFQDATVSQSASFGDFTHASPSEPTKQIGGFDMTFQAPVVPPQQTQISTDLIGEEDKFSALRIEPDKKPVDVMPVFSPPVESKTEVNEKSIIAKSESMLRNGEKLDVEFTADFAAFDDLEQKNKSVGKEETPVINSAPAVQDDFADFSSAPTAGPDKKDDFADFQSVTMTGPSADSSATVDKYAALKALVSDRSLYDKKEEEKSNIVEEAAKDKESDDWATFQDATSSVNTGNDLMSSDLMGSVTNEGLTPNLMPNAGEESKTESGDWAAFESASPAVGNDLDWASASAANEQTENSKGFTGFDAAKKILGIKANDTDAKPSTSMSASSSSNQISTAKVHHFFARNVEQGTVSAGTGMSPLDVAPPDMPDDIPDIPDDDFDKFGTFRSGLDDELASSNDFGLSSLGAAYGGLDDITEIGVKKPTPKSFPGLKTVGSKSKDLSDTQSVSSSEFTGWKGSSKASLKEDTQSVNSLEFNSVKKTSKEGSPSGIDSQSVSSLEFGAETGGIKKSSSTSPQDQNSVASLDFKSNAQDSGKEEGDFGEFSSATNNSQSTVNTSITNSEYIQNPRDIKDLLAAGSLPTIGSDRYSGFNETNEDTEDKHIHEWQRCLEKCSEMIGEANNTFNNISSPSVCTEVLESEQGEEYLKGILEIYKVVCRINYAMEAASVSSMKLKNLVKQIDIAWNNLSAYLTGTPAMPIAGSLDFSKGMLKADMDEAQSKACGVCLLDVNAPSKAPNIDSDYYKLTYGGRQYHAPCANFWVNCVDSMLPSLKIPELL